MGDTRKKVFMHSQSPIPTVFLMVSTDVKNFPETDKE